MSVPLDRLYHYLDHSIDRDVVIYRWVPHGAKKLQCLKPLRDYSAQELTQGTVIVAYDQEPIDLAQYNNTQAWLESINSYNEYWHTDITPQQWPWDQDHVLDSWIRPDLGANLTDAMVLLHGEPYSSHCAQAQALGWRTAWIWSNALIAQDWFRYAQHDPEITAPRHIQRTFLVYGRAWTHGREYRLWFFDQIIRRELADCCDVRFGARDQDHYYRDHEFADPTWRCDVQDLEHNFQQSTAPAWASADYDIRDYQTSMMEIVLETVIDRVHLTEKTCRALACAQPFMLAAGAGSLAFLRDHGFETYGDWIDESYDLEPNAPRRLSRILEEMHRIRCMTADQQQRIWPQMLQRAQRNRARFFSSDLHHQIMTQGVARVRTALDTVPRSGREWQRWSLAQ